jgi:lipopolysaccharide assembly outer membrane protein LptD (OstA)
VVLTVAEDKKAAKKADDTSPFGKGKMIITCDGPMEMNYDKGYAIFQNRVKVESEASAGAMTSDKMTVYFSAATKQIDRMVATGHVKIIRGENISTSDNAIFTASDKRLVLTGHPQLTMYTQEDKNVSP